jgi:hypothetical protein
MPDAQVEIKKVVIKIKDIELSLTIDEARALKKILNDAFGDKETIYVPTYPIYPTYPTIPWQPWIITYTTGTLCLAQESV